MAAAALYKKDWNWWIVGTLLMVLGLSFYWNEKAAAE